MATYTWNGSASIYTDPANWSPAGVPGPGDTALVGAGNVSFSPFGNEAFTGGETFLLSGTATLTLNLSPFTVLRGDTFVLPADAASAATTKLVSDNGFITVDGGTLVVSVPVEDSFFRVGEGTLEFGNSVGADVHVSVFGAEDPRYVGWPRRPPPGRDEDSVVKLDQPAAFEGVITPYFGSTIHVVGITADAVAFAPSTRAGARVGEVDMHLLEGGAAVASLHLGGFPQGTYSVIPLGVSVAPDGAGGTLIRPDFEPSSYYLGGLRLPGPYSQYSVNPTAGATVVSDGALTEYVNPGTTLTFTDGVLSFGERDPGSVLYRLYETALDRAPDEEGNLYWSKVLKDYRGNLATVAGGFLESAEYEEHAGAETTDTQFVARLYRDALGRAPEAAGESYWTGVLGDNQSRADVLANFSLTNEAVRHNAAGIAAAGAFYPDTTPWNWG